MTDILKVLTIQFWQMTLIGGFQINDKGGTTSEQRHFYDLALLHEWPVSMTCTQLLLSLDFQIPPAASQTTVPLGSTSPHSSDPGAASTTWQPRAWENGTRLPQIQTTWEPSTHRPAPLTPPRLHASLGLVTTSRLQVSALILNSNFWASPLTDWPALSSTHPWSNSPFWHCLTQRQEATFTDCYWLPGTLYWERCWGHIQTQWGKSTMMSLRWEKIHVMHLPSGFRIFINIGPSPLWFQRPNSLFHNSNSLDLLDLFITKYFPTSNEVLLHFSHSSTSPTLHFILIRTFKHEALPPHPLKSLPCFTGLLPLDSVVNS